ncbi:MAG: hypothetical protein MZV64_62940 [Ignavibacteriales bacterium]|nr:hypothetical protein [Ignavibacteriales bacterium]
MKKRSIILITIGVTQADAAKIVDGTAKTSLWKRISQYIFDWRILVFCILILALAIVSYYTYRAAQKSSQLDVTVVKLQKQIETQQSDISRIEDNNDQFRATL